ncbi:MAG: hypothetical protein JO356_21495 [Acidobacteria bacterium]|nr:hypothetical protein [Acidobacteriota bacterium]
MPQSAMFVVYDVRLLLWAGIGIVAGIYWFSRGFVLLQRKRLILDTPASKIRSASMGLVEISGQATGPHVVISPLQARSCYYYRAMAWELRENGKKRDWVKLAEETLHVPFYLDDGTDKVLVDPRAAEMDLHRDLQEQYRESIFSEGTQMSGSVKDFLIRNRANLSRQIKVEEYTIKPKNFLFVLGTLSQNPGIDASVVPSGAQRSEAVNIRNASEARNTPEIIRLSPRQEQLPLRAMTQQQKVAAALMKAGIHSPAAWNPTPLSSITGENASASVMTTAAESEANGDVGEEDFDLHPSVVLMKGTHQPAFFISWRSQREVVASLGWKSTLMIWGGPVLTLGCLYWLLAHLGRL